MAQLTLHRQSMLAITDPACGMRVKYDEIPHLPRVASHHSLCFRFAWQGTRLGAGTHLNQISEQSQGHQRRIEMPWQPEARLAADKLACD